MPPIKWFAACAIAACVAGTCLAQGGSEGARLSAAEVVEKNAAARGGAEAWRKVETMAWGGHVEGGGTPRPLGLTFVLEQKRSGATRFEITGEGQKSVRIFDGSSGWKVRTGSNGMPEVLAYSEDELRFARQTHAIDGPLMDYAARGGLITIAGVDVVEGRRAYVMDVKLPSGGLHRVWVDAESFLELRHDREVRRASGQAALMTVLFRNYHAVEGLQIPLVIETGSPMDKGLNRLVIERVVLNPPLDEQLFAKPVMPVSRRAGSAVVDTRRAAAEGPTRPAP